MTIEIVELYNRLTESTSVAFDTGAKQLVEDISRNNHISAMFLAGKGMKQILAQGPRIKDRILLDSRSVLQRSRPGAPRNFSNPQSGTNHSIHWSYYVSDLRWDEVELAHNVDPTGMNKKGIRSFIKDVMYQKEQDLYVNMTENFDDLFFATPDAKLMEHLNDADVGESPMMASIPMFINEETNGLFTGYDNTNGDFSTIMGVNPVAKSNWRCSQVGYDASSSNIASMNVGDNLIAALELQQRRLKFVPPSMWQQYFQNATSLAKHVIVTGEKGATAHHNAIRSNGDMFSRLQNKDGSILNSSAGGIPIVEYQELDNQALYAGKGTSAGTLVTSNAGDNTNGVAMRGGRYYFLNLEYMWPKFYKDKFFTKGKVKEIPNTDGAYRQPVQLWTQLWCKSLRRHGIVFPTTTATV